MTPEKSPPFKYRGLYLNQIEIHDMLRPELVDTVIDIGREICRACPGSLTAEAVEFAVSWRAIAHTAGNEGKQDIAIFYMRAVNAFDEAY